MRRLARVTLAGMVSLGAALVLGVLLLDVACGERDALAARYNLRSRTDRFFDRANPPRAASSRQTADEETAVAEVGRPAPNAVVAGLPTEPLAPTVGLLGARPAPDAGDLRSAIGGVGRPAPNAKPQAAKRRATASKPAAQGETAAR